MPLKRICEAADITPSLLYDRIDFFHEQAVAFLSERERKLHNTEIERLYVGVDRQDHVINWSMRKDKGNVTLSSIAAADNATGCVFGMVPNFDPDCDPESIEREHLALGHGSIAACHRRHARLWLKADFDAAVAASQRFQGDGTLAGSILASYSRASSRPDVDSPEAVAAEDMLPEPGMLVHGE